MSRSPRFVAADFPVPASLEQAQFRLRMLSADDVEGDYQAVMASQARLRAGSPHGWPRPGFTLAENLQDLLRHEQEFRDRIAFAYTMVSPDESVTLGCVYINPPGSTSDAQPDSTEPGKQADAFVYMWVRDEYQAALSGSLFEAVDTWLKERWPFKTVQYIRTGYYQNGGAEP